MWLLLTEPKSKIDLADQIIRMIGWPTVLGMVVWLIKELAKAKKEVKLAIVNISETRAKIEDISRLSTNSAEQLNLLQSLDKSMVILIDRMPRT